ncbi:hypothetical protein GZ77_03375 [Endozoicomonas montiporae]|uniref:DUF2970 domain-containing protein n=1 Tax=Endozoicomonas montiporae TaxID=1027273 RepID=A0A081NB15_9GAMM|nr:DUF2970 domain-containing protein [Endozoicomonas montiporae]KEQ15638.1 hypothetical protein GZ77_03375 [Endozoicomonas montiporae]
MQKKREKGTGVKAILQSAFASAFGVQSKKNLSRDFNQGRPADFIIAGIIGTVLFVTVLVVIVKTILTVSAS